MKYSYVIPCYNSEYMIEDVVKDVFAAMSELKVSEYDYEIILVNDYSKDNTAKVICELSKKYSVIKYVLLAKNFGQEAACLAGYRKSKGEFVITMDDDGQTPPLEVGKLINKIQEGFDVVYAKYSTKHHSNFRNLGSKVNDYMAEKLIQKPKGLYLGTYFIMRRFVVEQIISYRNPYPYIRGLVLQCTSNIVNVNVEHRDRLVGKSNYSLKKLLKIWFNGFTSFSIKPLRVSLLLGLGSASFSIALLIYAVVAKLLHPENEIGWASIIATISFFGGVILLVLGMIGEYIGRTYICINDTPQYVIREASIEE